MTITLAEQANIVASAYTGSSPIRIPSRSHCRILRAHADFAPLAESECEVSNDGTPRMPGLLGYLKGTPVYYRPVEEMELA